MASRRIELHREVAGRLRHHWGTEAPRIATEIARHCEEGRDAEGAVAFRGHAGDNAARLFAYAEAEEHYDWAFRSFEKLPAESRPAAAISLHRRRGTVRLAQARFDDATADFESMLAGGAGDRGGRGRARGAGRPVRHALLRPAGRGDGGPRAGAARGGHACGAEPATRPRPARGSARPSSARGASKRRSRCSTTRSRPPGGSARRWRSRSRSSYRGLVHYWQTEYQATETRVRRGPVAQHPDSATASTPSPRACSWASPGCTSGRISEALDDFADAISVARRNDDRYWLPRLVSHLGLGAPRAGRPRSRPRVRHRGRPAGPRAAGWGPESEALLNLCVDDVREGRAERAAALLAELQARAAQSSWMRWMSELRLAAASAEHWAVRGDHDARARARGAARGDGGAPRGARLPLHRRADPGGSRARARRGHRERGRAPGRGSRRAARQARPARGLEVGTGARDRAAPARRRRGRAQPPSPRPPAR